MNSAIHYLLHASGPQQVSYFDSNFSRLERTVRLLSLIHICNVFIMPSP